VTRVIVTAACRALAGVVVLGVVLVSFESAGYTPIRSHPVLGPAFCCSVMPFDPYIATPWWAYAVPVVCGLLGLALAVWLYRVAPRVVDRHILIRRSAASSSL
jgi:hypothetical protein